MILFISALLLSVSHPLIFLAVHLRRVSRTWKRFHVRLEVYPDGDQVATFGHVASGPHIQVSRIEDLARPYVLLSKHFEFSFSRGLVVKRHTPSATLRLVVVVFRLLRLLAIASFKWLVLFWNKEQANGTGTLAPTFPSEAEAMLAKETSRVLASRVQSAEPLLLRILDDPAKGTLELPASAVRMLIHILEEMARGNAVALIPCMPNLRHRKPLTC